MDVLINRANRAKKIVVLPFLFSISRSFLTAPVDLLLSSGTNSLLQLYQPSRRHLRLSVVDNIGPAIYFFLANSPKKDILCGCCGVKWLGTALIILILPSLLPVSSSASLYIFFNNHTFEPVSPPLPSSRPQELSPPTIIKQHNRQCSLLQARSLRSWRSWACYFPTSKVSNFATI